MTREEWLEHRLKSILKSVKLAQHRRQNPGGQHTNGRPPFLSSTNSGDLQELEEELLIALTTPEESYKDTKPE